MLSTKNPKVNAPNNPTEIHNLTFRNDLGNAAGLDKDGDLLAFNYLLGAGFAVVGTTLYEPHKGNIIKINNKEVNPWMPLYHSNSAINSLSLPSKGVFSTIFTIHEFRQEYQPENFPIGVSLAEHPKHKPRYRLEKLVTSYSQLLHVADFIELNISCPNVKQEQSDLKEKVKLLIEARDWSIVEKYVPLFVKLQKYDPDYASMLMSIGVDGLVLVNSQNYKTINQKINPKDAKSFHHYTEHHGGGVSGQLIKYTARRETTKAKQDEIDVIHVGGIETPEDMIWSRTQPNIILRQWYTGLMHSLATKQLEGIYPDMVNVSCDTSSTSSGNP